MTNYCIVDGENKLAERIIANRACFIIHMNSHGLIVNVKLTLNLFILSFALCRFFTLITQTISTNSIIVYESLPLHHHHPARIRTGKHAVPSLPHLLFESYIISTTPLHSITHTSIYYMNE